MGKNILRVACAVICLAPVLSPAQNLSDQKIEFDKTSVNVKQIVNTLDNYLDVNAPKSFKWNYSIDLPSKTMKLNNLIEVVQSTTPYFLQLENNRLDITVKKIEKEYIISGKISDAETGEPLTGANIYLKQSGSGSVSDPDGSYQMVLSPGKHILICSFIGYKQLEKTIYLFDNKAINISLATQEQEIEEVKISTSRHLFGDMKTGRTIERIDSKVIESLPLNMVSDALHGSVKGVWSTKMSGAPGDHQKLRIRGISSILGSTDPLYVIDGMPVPIVNLKSLGISDLNVHDIESISILKDASSTALYGYHGGNGVILIDTKKGGGETEFSFSTKIGFQQFNKRYDLLKTEEFLWNLQQSDRVLRTDFYRIIPDRHYEEYPVYIDTAGNVMGYTDWQDRIFKTGIINEYQLSAKGQIKTINYYFSANIFNHEGVVLSSQYKKKTFTGSVNRSFKDKLNIGFQLRFSNEENENNLDSYLGNKMILKGINTEPAFVTTPDSFLYKRDRFFINNSRNVNSEIIERLSNTIVSPDSIAMYKRNLDTKIYTGNLFFKLHIFDNLHLNSTLSGSFRDMRYMTDEEPDLLKSDEGIVILHHQTNLSYFNDFEKHHIQLTLGIRNYTDNTYWKIDSMYRQRRRRYSSGADIYLRGSQAKFGPEGASIRSIHSMLGHLNYNYNNKYFISLVANYDHLIDGDYLDVKSLFPSVAINYDLSREMFLNSFRRLDFILQRKTSGL